MASASSSSAPGGPPNWLRAMGLGCGVVAFGGLCVLGLSAPMIFAQADDAAAAVTGFLADVRARDHRSALQRMGEDYQREHDAAALGEAIGRIDPLEDHVTAFVTTVERRDDDARATVEGLLYGPFGEAGFAFELHEQGGYWYIDLVVVDGRLLE